VTPSVAAPGDTNPSDATAFHHFTKELKQLKRPTTVKYSFEDMKRIMRRIRIML